MIPDVTVGLIAYLKADSTLNALVGGRIFGHELPAVEASQMPRKSVVLTDTAGGSDPWSSTYVRATGSRIDVRCYGETPYEAMRVHRLVYPLMKHLRAHNRGEIRLYAVKPLTSASALRDPDTRWPFVLIFYNALYSEKPIEVEA